MCIIKLLEETSLLPIVALYQAMALYQNVLGYKASYIDFGAGNLCGSGNST
ncbi:hypothetical protein APHCRT_0970 [Anaplasma phagocytophilum str. CRT53-1]|uniref:Uncharacterized protein n=3 Tax=Anaplasma phagocytophilum TaxID=948 RepID=Q2GJN0_ANAPZ|nr:hypothetical protein APH_0844 [Anaplasma phagocytophilum str. HZ]KJV60542.1 hypothetical protein APHWEB_1166 [Anaplasma phagocytophilum str. Webster]KJV83489.1 hypothetical protein APHHGE2_1147 [Anaplasma phagocytophilum str. HGE2]KJV84907.1 hypothetical protein APHWI1_0351 [Anaplasma phagocytophilum str. ApWI1]KJV85699.1 hypothetical protein APHCRT_0970 [Anaplasma phagocytophilum str. CRT53-1]KJV98646.1 hypothetical protein OTSANNIE_1119 [Anaplasma phagocytophilum str. Annie]